MTVLHDFVVIVIRWAHDCEKMAWDVFLIPWAPAPRTARGTGLCAAIGVGPHKTRSKKHANFRSYPWRRSHSLENDLVRPPKFGGAGKTAKQKRGGLGYNIVTFRAGV